MAARRVVITGRVQGVFFRAWTKEQADALGVAGWVRNRPDGSVEALIEGSQAAVDAPVERLHEGPPQARVDKVEIVEADGEGADRFTIRH